MRVRLTCKTNIFTTMKELCMDLQVLELSRRGQRLGALGNYHVPAFRSVVTGGESRPAVCRQKGMDLLRQRLRVCVVLHATVCHRGQLVTGRLAVWRNLLWPSQSVPDPARHCTCPCGQSPGRRSLSLPSWTHHRDTVSVCVGNAGNRPRYESTLTVTDRSLVTPTRER